MEDPDHGWKPNGRPQSTIARNFMSELDDLFKLDGGLDKLDKNVHQKKQAVSSHTQELEALEARLRETEERLKQAKSSPPAARKNSQRRTPIRGTLPDEDKAQLGESSSPLAHAQARQRSGADLKTAKDMPDRPHSAQNSEDEQV